MLTATHLAGIQDIRNIQVNNAGCRQIFPISWATDRTVHITVWRVEAITTHVQVSVLDDWKYLHELAV